MLLKVKSQTELLICLYPSLQTRSFEALPIAVNGIPAFQWLGPKTSCHPCCLSFSFSHPNYQKTRPAGPIPTRLTDPYSMATVLDRTTVPGSLGYRSGSRLVSVLLHCSSAASHSRGCGGSPRHVAVLFLLRTSQGLPTSHGADSRSSLQPEGSVYSDS